MSSLKNQGLSHGSEQLISLVRQPNELFALVSRRVAGADGNASFESSRVPIMKLQQSVCPAKDRVQESWNQLSAVTAVDQQILYHTFVILLETVPDMPSAKSVNPLPAEWTVAPAPPRASEAHPRAFKGTKYQPPKLKSLPQVDVRSCLCDPLLLRKLLSSLWKFLSEVRNQLLKAGYTRTQLDAVERELRGERQRKRPPNLSLGFVRQIWPSVRFQPPRQISAYLALFADLDLDKDQRLLEVVSRLVAIAEPYAAHEWCRIADLLPAERRISFVEKLLETAAYESEPAADVRSFVGETSELAPIEAFPIWIEQLLKTTRKGGPFDYLLAGFRLAAQFAPHYRFEKIVQCENFPERIVEELAIDVGSEWLCMLIWERCGQLAGFADVVRDSKWRCFSQKAKGRYFHFLTGVGYQNLSAARLGNKWRAIRQQIPRIEVLILNTPPEFQTKVIDYLEDWLWYWDEPASIKKWMQRAYQIIPRLAAAPYSTAPDAASTIGWFIEIEDDQAWQRVVAAPERSLVNFERECRRKNAARSIALGIKSLTQELVTFTIKALYQAPRKLARTAEILGGVAFNVRKQILERCRDHPLFQLDPLTVPAEIASEIIRKHSRKSYTNPIPERLSAWVRGSISLPPTRIERYRRAMADNLLDTRLDLIQASVIDWLRQGLPIDEPTKQDHHALRMLGSVDDNRRGLRKFLKAYWSGERDYVAKHRATVSWYGKHPQLARDLWENGIPFPTGDQQITIAIERDPLEILRLGTYVGSCLGLGGGFSYSAVATVLDANKRVLYARDQEGTVVARQLIAISKDNHLVCFYVYPVSTNPLIREMFRGYDKALARALELPLYDSVPSDDNPYEIDNVLAKSWWDDGNWDLEAVG